MRISTPSIKLGCGCVELLAAVRKIGMPDAEASGRPYKCLFLAASIDVCQPKLLGAVQQQYHQRLHQQ